jgi:hypothetical protein
MNQNDVHDDPFDQGVSMLPPRLGLPEPESDGRSQGDIDNDDAGELKNAGSVGIMMFGSE